MRSERFSAFLAVAVIFTFVSPTNAHAFSGAFWRHRLTAPFWPHSPDKPAPPAPPAPPALPAECQGVPGILNNLLYQAVFFRSPDYPAAAVWCPALSGGFDGFVAVAQALSTSAEFKTRILASYTRAEIVGQFYLELLNRPLDPSGNATWVLSTTYDYPFILNQVITFGNEFKNRYYSITGTSPPPPPPPPPADNCAGQTGDLQGLVQCYINEFHPTDYPSDFEVTKRVAWALRAQGGALLYITSGSALVTWQGQTYSASRICYNSEMIKIIMDAGPGGANGPEWLDNGPTTPGQCLQPLDPSLP
jgi:hypothetical protein